MQHLKGLEILAKFSNYDLLGGTIGSKEITLTPKDESIPSFNKLKVKIGTAASVSLLYQILSNYSFFSKRELELEFFGGGTHTKWAPNFDYLERVTIPNFNQFGQMAEIKLQSFGFFPKGGAEGKLKIYPKISNSLTVNKSVEIKDILLISCVSKDLAHKKVAERQIKGFGELSNFDLISEIRYVETKSTGTSITAVINYKNNFVKGASFLGEKKISAEKVGILCRNKVEEMMSNNAQVDEYMADQILIPLSLSKSQTQITIPEITNHVKTNVSIIEKLQGSIFDIKKSDNLIKIKRK